MIIVASRSTPLTVFKNVMLQVPEHLNKVTNDETDLYAQVGGVEATDSQVMFGLP